MWDQFGSHATLVDTCTSHPLCLCRSLCTSAVWSLSWRPALRGTMPPCLLTVKRDLGSPLQWEVSWTGDQRGRGGSYHGKLPYLAKFVYRYIVRLTSHLKVSHTLAIIPLVPCWAHPPEVYRNVFACCHWYEYCIYVLYGFYSPLELWTGYSSCSPHTPPPLCACRTLRSTGTSWGTYLWVWLLREGVWQGRGESQSERTLKETFVSVELNLYIL